MIPQTRYIKITSGVGGATQVATRQLILRAIITDDAMAPQGLTIEFDNADDVGDYFGRGSQAYARAVLYFAYVSRVITSPGSISFTGWSLTDYAPTVIGSPITATIDQIKAIGATGSITFFVDGVSTDITPIDVSSVATLSDVVTTLKAAINANENAQLKTATVSLSPDGTRIVIVGGTAGSGSIMPTTGDAGSLTALLGLDTGSGAMGFAGDKKSDISDVIASSTESNNNFGTMVFPFVTNTPGTAFKYPFELSEATKIAQWNESQNNMYIMSFQLSPTMMTEWGTELKKYAGCATNKMLEFNQNEFIDQVPGEILGATQYENSNTIESYMFTQFSNRTPSVTSSSEANAADALRVNYIGKTQTAGQPYAFYQRGLLGGGATAPSDMKVYAGEMWLKDYIAAQIMNDFLSVPDVSADTDGEAIIISSLQDAVDLAKRNTVIAVGKPLTNVQKLYIKQISGDDTAYHQVQTIGYWYTVSIASKQNGNDPSVTDYYATYKLIYSKNDTIRFVEGSDILI